MIALQIAAFSTNEKDITLVFTKVLDRISLGTEEDETIIQTDRNYWEKRSNPKVLSLMDSIFNAITTNDERLKLKYNKFYIGIEKDGITRNFITFRPKKNYVWLCTKGVLNEEAVNAIEEAGLDISYNNRWREYRIKINKYNDYNNNKDSINVLINQARDDFNI